MTLEIGPSLAALLAMCITGWMLQRPVIDQAIQKMVASLAQVVARRGK